MARKPDLYVATSTGAVRVEGKTINYAAGKTLVRAGHPILLALPGRFRPVEDILEPTPKPRPVTVTSPTVTTLSTSPRFSAKGDK